MQFHVETQIEEKLPPAGVRRQTCGCRAAGRTGAAPGAVPTFRFAPAASTVRSYGCLPGSRHAAIPPTVSLAWTSESINRGGLLDLRLRITGASPLRAQERSSAASVPLAAAGREQRLRRRGSLTRRFAGAGLLLVAGCAVRPATSVASLEERLATAADETDTRLRLAAAYHADGRATDAIGVLDPVVQSSPDDPAVLFLLARSYENDQRFAAARETFERFLAVNVEPKLNRRVRARIELLRRRELELAVRNALADETTLRNATPSPRVIGVFPLLFAGADSALAPLGRALAEMLTTDLAQTDRLTIVERAGIQLLLDEIRLGASATVDPATAARAGRLIGAGRIVQGRLDGDAVRLRLEALVVTLAEPRDSSTAPARVDGPLDDLFAMEKQLALALFADIGIALTAAERERVLRRPTDNVQALLEFGLGLQADDANRWTEAVRFFERAVTMDGDFGLARIWLERSRHKAQATQEDDGELDGLAEFELGWDLPAWLRLRLPFGLIERLVPDPDLRNPAPELLGVEGLDRRSRIDVIIRPPGGR